MSKLHNKWIDYIKQLNQLNILPANTAVHNADLVLNNRFIFDHPYDMEPTTTIIDFNPIQWQISPNGDPEWLYMLKRQEYLADLLHAYYITTKLTYLSKAKQLIFEWITQNLTSPQTWRTIDTGIRLLNWAPIIPILNQQSLLTHSEQATLSHAVKQQVQYLRQHYIEKYDISNWGVLITTGILVYAAINESSISKIDIDWAMDRLECELMLQVNPDGTHWEQSPLYFLEVWKSTLSVYAAYQQKNLLFPEQLLKILKAMHHCAPYFVKPNHLLLQQGDTDSIRIDSLYQSSGLLLNSSLVDAQIANQFDFGLVELRHQYGIQSFLDKQSQKPIIKKETSLDSKITGNYYWRKDWSENADYWHIYNGTLGSGHGHAALGHIDLVLNGHDVLVDPGRFSYVDGTERRYLKSVSAHNTIEIDNRPFTLPRDSWKFSEVGLPLNNIVDHYKDLDVVSINYLEHPADPQSPLIIRYFIWLKEYEIMIIVDAIKAPGHHTVKTRYNFASDLINKTKQDEINLKNSSIDIKMVSSIEKYFLKRSLFSPRYNQLTHLNQLEFSRTMEDYALQYTIIGETTKFTQVRPATIIQSGEPNVMVPPENCFAFEISLDQSNSIIVCLQWLNTFIGRKLYLVNNNPIYGTLNIIYLHNGKETHRTHVQ